MLCSEGLWLVVESVSQFASYFAIGSGEMAPGLGQRATLGSRKIRDEVLEDITECAEASM